MAILKGIIGKPWREQFHDLIFASTEGYEAAWTARYKGTQPEWTKGVVPAYRTDIKNKFTWIMRTWSETLTPADRLLWALGNVAFHNRYRYPKLRPPHLRWLNVQFPLHHGKLPITFPEIDVYPYLIEAIHFDVANSKTQRLAITVAYTRTPPPTQDYTHRTVVHIHQVPKKRVGRYVAARYAKFHESNELYNPHPYPVIVYTSMFFDSHYTFTKGERMQLYMRLTELKKYPLEDAGPKHRTQTWDWYLLQKDAT